MALTKAQGKLKGKPTWGQQNLRQSHGLEPKPQNPMAPDKEVINCLDQNVNCEQRQTRNTPTFTADVWFDAPWLDVFY